MMNGFGNGFNGYSNMMGGGWLGGALFLLVGILIIAGATMLVFWAVRTSRGNNAAEPIDRPVGVTGHDEAVAIAKRRFAIGEIDRDQYEELMRSLDR